MVHDPWLTILGERSLTDDSWWTIPKYGVQGGRSLIDNPRWTDTLRWTISAWRFLADEPWLTIRSWRSIIDNPRLTIIDWCSQVDNPWLVIPGGRSLVKGSQVDEPGLTIPAWLMIPRGRSLIEDPSVIVLYVYKYLVDDHWWKIPGGRSLVDDPWLTIPGCTMSLGVMEKKTQRDWP